MLMLQITSHVSVNSATLFDCRKLLRKPKLRKEKRSWQTQPTKSLASSEAKSSRLRTQPTSAMRQQGSFDDMEHSWLRR